jgi:hypothetical protein
VVVANDVVLTTYSTLMADSRQGGGVLNLYTWYRIVLDEGELFRALVHFALEAYVLQHM